MTEPCPVCGTWRCADCDWTRARANRFSRDPQSCGRCGSTNGKMEPVHHQPHVDYGHRADYPAQVAAFGEPRYPVS